jgi:ABC-2 type transport system ATP-binding protein
MILNLGKEKTILLSTHIMQEVQAMCQRVIIINKGDIVADASIDDIKKIGSSKMIVLKSEHVLDPSIFKDLPNTKITKVNKNTLSFECNEVEQTRKLIMQICVTNDLSISQIGIEEKNLEEIFSTLTAKTEKAGSI